MFQKVWGWWCWAGFLAGRELEHVLSSVNTTHTRIAQPEQHIIFITDRQLFSKPSPYPRRVVDEAGGVSTTPSAHRSFAIWAPIEPTSSVRSLALDCTDQTGTSVRAAAVAALGAIDHESVFAPVLIALLTTRA